MAQSSDVQMQWLQIFGITDDKNIARYGLLRSGFITRDALTTVTTNNHTKHSSVHNQNIKWSPVTRRRCTPILRSTFGIQETSSACVHLRITLGRERHAVKCVHTHTQNNVAVWAYPNLVNKMIIILTQAKNAQSTCIFKHDQTVLHPSHLYPILSLHITNTYSVLSSLT
jgi:hypothetical protein